MKTITYLFVAIVMLSITCSAQISDSVIRHSDYQDNPTIKQFEK